MSSDPGDSDDESAALRARLNRLSSELKGRAPPRPSEPAPTPKTDASATGSALALALRAGSERGSGAVIGLGIGWGLDRALHTNPAFLIVFVFIGVAAGIWNVIRLTSPKRSP